MARPRWWWWSVALAGALCMTTGAPRALAYDVYDDGSGGNCATCHGDFNGADYTSKTDSVAWGTNLHDGHRYGMLEGECDTCHSAGGRSPVNLSSSRGGAGLDPIACVGCHGRAEDDTVSNPSVLSGYGAGLRQHHYDAGITGCSACHADADPTMYTPVGEEVLPPYYSASTSTYPSMPLDSCNPAGTEAFYGSTGLDNDGDGFWDDADDDCYVDPGPPDAGPPDAGAADAGAPDAGAADAGAPDAGAVDAGPPDATVPADGGERANDAAVGADPDASSVPAGDGGGGVAASGDGEGGCSASGRADAGHVWLGLLLGILLLRRRRR